MGNFYCANEAGYGFTIKDWNTKNKLANKLNLSDSQRRKFIKWGCKCESQCENCACIVGERQMKTKQLIKKYNIK